MKLRVVCFGYGGSVAHADKLKPIIEKLDMELVKISEWDDADIKYDSETINQELQKCDICILPCDYVNQPHKSFNRLVQAYANKLPVIASPMPSYMEIGKGITLFASSDLEWELHLELLKSEEIRNVFGKAGYKLAQNFSPEKIANKWETTFEELMDTPSKDIPKVDLIIPSYNNLDYLKLTIESIEKNTSHPYELCIVDSSTDQKVIDYLKTVKNHKVIFRTEKTSFAIAVNVGAQNTSNPYLVVLNNDLIVTKNWLTNLMDKMTEDTAAIGPLSNCDYGWLNNIEIDIKGVKLRPNMTISEFENIDDLMNLETFLSYYGAPSNIVTGQKTNWLAMYCTLISREVWDKVGKLDETFINNAEDVDWMQRASKMGYKVYQSFDSYVFHFGGKTRKISENENHSKHHEEDQFSSKYLNEKYAKPLSVIYCGAGLEKWGPNNLEQGGIGGSETWAIWLSRELSNLGYKVIVFGDPKKEIKDDPYEVQYYHWTRFDSFIETNFIDYFISSRTTDPFNKNLKTGMNLCMVHDIWLGDKAYPLHLDKVDKFLCLSEWHKDFFASHHNVPKDKILLTSNGIDRSLFMNSEQIEKKKNTLIYSSSPDRGLNELIDVVRIAKKDIPDLSLNVYYGFDNWEKIAKSRNDVNQINFINNLKKKMEETEGVFYHGRVSQKELAEKWKESSVWCYPTWFAETFCITALESMASRTPILCSDIYGLKTTVKNSGKTINFPQDGYSYTEECKQKFAKELVQILKDEELYKSLQEKGTRRVERFGWDSVAKQFHKYFQEEIWEEIQ